MNRLLTFLLTGALACCLALPARADLAELFSYDATAEWQAGLTAGNVRAPTAAEGAMLQAASGYNYGDPTLDARAGGQASYDPGVLHASWDATEPTVSAWVYQADSPIDIRGGQVNFGVRLGLIDWGSQSPRISLGLMDSVNGSGVCRWDVTAGESNWWNVSVSFSPTGEASWTVNGNTYPGGCDAELNFEDVNRLVFDLAGGGGSSCQWADWDYANTRIEYGEGDEVPEPCAWVLLLSASLLGGWIKRHRP